MTPAGSPPPIEPATAMSAASAGTEANADWLRPALSLAGVGALMTTRNGGASVAPFDSMNVGTAVGDDPLVVAANRRRFEAAIGAAPVYLRQVHGVRVVRLGVGDLSANLTPEADACFTTERGVACAVQVADCMPVLFAVAGDGGHTGDGVRPGAGADPGVRVGAGTATRIGPHDRHAMAVGAAHAGWRGLAAGVVERTVNALCEASGRAPRDITAWLGPCIGPTAFEVGADVLRGFGLDPAHRSTPRFAARSGGKWLADLPGLATDRLRALGVGQVIASGECTVSQPARFFSFRRDRQTGRMVAAIWLE